MQDFLFRMYIINLLKDEVDMKSILAGIDSDSTETLNSMKLRTCPKCKNNTIAPYIFCQKCLSKNKIRLIESCQVPNCLANNRMAYELLTKEQLLETSNVKKPKRMRKQSEKTKKARDKVLQEGFDSHCHDICLHSRTSSSADECIFESLVGVFGDLIKNGLIGLLKHTTPKDSLDHIKKAVDGQWVSRALSYNRCQCYDELNMKEHATCIAKYLDTWREKMTIENYLSEGIRSFIQDSSPEKRMGLGGNL